MPIVCLSHLRGSRIGDRAWRFAGFLGCAVGLATLLQLSTPSAAAQSIYDMIGTAQRTVKKSLRSVDRAISDAAPDLNGQPAGKRAGSSDRGRVARGAAVPPLPVRQPKPWHAKTKPVTGKPATTAARTPPAPRPAKSQRITNPQRKRTPAPDASWPTTLQDVEAEKARKAAPPDVWPDLDINVAKARCTHLLKQVNAEVEFLDPIKKGPCGDPAPVKLSSLGENPRVAVSPPATVNCNMVFALHQWLEKDLQPLARKHLGQRITVIENMSSYSCRNAYGRTTTRLSEHGRANALDIRGFRTSGGKVAHLLQHWGPTERDVAAYRLAQKKAAEKRAAEIAATKAERKARELATRSQSGSATRSVAEAGPDNVADSRPTLVEGIVVRSADGETAVPVPSRSGVGFAPSRLGGPKAAVSGGRPPSQAIVRKVVAPIDMKKKSTPRARFLREAHKRACKLFGTTLGPEANNAHRNHFHVDLAPRKRSNFCE